MDTVFISNLRAPTVVGVFDWERRMRRELRLDLEMGTDVTAAAREDRLEAALDYDAAARAVTELLAENEYKLIETVAEAVARELFSRFSLAWLRLCVRKPWAVADANEVGVRIERTADDYADSPEAG